MHQATTHLAGLALAALVGLAQPAAAQGVAAPSGADRTPAIVAAADAFLATLDEGGREAVLFDWIDDAPRARWSNLPARSFERAGLRWGDLSEPQRQALTDLLGTVLSPEGLAMVREQMLATELLNGRGSDYYVSFVGEPSATSPWMLQFGGHHLGINATVAGPDVTLAPSLTGGQPVRFTHEGEAIDIVADEVAAARALVASLDGAQRAQAVRSEARADLVLGPGEDGRRIETEGLLGRDMTGEQRRLLLALVEARLDVLNAEDLAAAMAPVEANLDATAFALYGPADDPASAYWRVTGPTVVVEYAPQGRGEDASQHLHNVYRDPTNDYGAAWVPQG